jgi:hypothetical protein
VVSGSHRGTSAAQFVLDVGGSAYPDLVIYNDAGVGKNGAGIAALDMLERAGVAALNIEAGRSVFELVEELRR